MSPTTSGLLVYFIVFGTVFLSCVERVNESEDPPKVSYRQLAANAALWPVHLALLVLEKILAIVNHLTK
jgi:hypothetical protein